METHLTLSSLQTPPGAWDCHMHIIDHNFPFAPEAAFKPDEATLENYAEIQKKLGLEFWVLVQANSYAGDNSCLFSALEKSGSKARGVAVISREDFEKRQRDGKNKTFAGFLDKNVRSLRFHLLPGGILDWADLGTMAPAATDAGLTLNLQFDGRQLPNYRDFLKKTPGTFVIDHTAKFLEPLDPKDEAFQALLSLIDTGRVWVKISAPYETSRSGPPLYEDVGLLAAELGKRAPERLLWASNWPHLSPKADAPKPDESMLLNWFYHWIPNPAKHQRILCENPKELYL